jgi:hypothetical protein
VSLRDAARRVLRGIKQRVSPADLGYMDWSELVARDSARWQRALATASGPQVLIGTTIGRFKWEVNFDSALAVALTLRGARVRVLVCDHQLPACSAWVRQTYPATFSPLTHSPQATLCADCLAPTLGLFAPLGIPVLRYSDLISTAERDAALAKVAGLDLEGIRALAMDGVAVGEHSIAGAIRFFACARLEDEPGHMDVTRRYLHAAILTKLAAHRAMTSPATDVVCGSHGIYVPQGLVSEVARSLGTRVVNWHQAYRQKCVLFSHGDTYHKTLLNEPASEWKPSVWTPEMEREIVSYLDSRQYGKQDWISFNREPDARSIEAAKAMGVDFDRPCIGLLTNVAWDAQLHYGATPFTDMMTWVVETIRYFAARPELQLLIRIHPAEVKGYIPSRQPALAEIQRAFPTLPPNVFVIPPESTISTYETMERCNAVIIYATKTGIELSARGVPVIVAGEAWIKNKGFALDAATRSDYVRVLDTLPLPARLDAERTTLARQYAHHFFMRRMIPVAYLDDKMRPEVPSLAALESGRDAGMDTICDGVLTGESFIYRGPTA